MAVHNFGNSSLRNKSEKTKKYIQLCNEKIKEDQNNFQAYCEQGYNYLAIKDHKKAKEMFEKAIKINPKCWLAYSELAFISLRMGEKEEAKKYALIAAQNDNFNGLLISGTLSMDENIDESLKFFHRALGINDKNPVLWERIAKAFAKKGLAGRAIVAYNTANELAPKASNYVEAGFLLVNKALYENALEYFDKAIELEKNHKAFYGKAICFIALEKNEEAIYCLKTSLGIKESIIALDALSKIYIVKNNFEEAKLLLERILQLDPNHKDAKHNLDQIEKLQQSKV
ncbi:MAG: tetratricopeptide repeat protein [Candidatus Woesearchaeota archaeon]